VTLSQTRSLHREACCCGGCDVLQIHSHPIPHEQSLAAVKGAGSPRVCRPQFGASLSLDAPTHPASSCSQHWVMGHRHCRRLPQGQEARGAVGLRDWRVVVVTYLAGTPLHKPPITSLSFPRCSLSSPVLSSVGGDTVVLCCLLLSLIPVVCQWGSPSFTIVHCHPQSLSCPVVCCWSRGGSFVTTGGGTGIVVVVGAWELVVTEWKW
jgi:hypothetical protein